MRAPPSPSDAVKLTLERDGGRWTVTCVARAERCQRTWHRGEVKGGDEVARTLLQPGIEDLARSPLMRTDHLVETDRPARWSIVIGRQRNRRGVLGVELRRALDVYWPAAVFFETTPERVPHPELTLEIWRSRGDPVSRFSRTRWHCATDALWCEGEAVNEDEKTVEHGMLWTDFVALMTPEAIAELMQASWLQGESDIIPPPGLGWTLTIGDRKNSDARALGPLGEAASRALSGLFTAR